ncbi:hypothetical protein DXT99_22705 [Pontibacter diazotrophicus]|uniref:Uncharacterized protein n=1 Tax=Pontibacter diazotrophicus TaxID=1400979 RepID=A0A3D8L5A6_9BACT|nr:hypothetical protein [Pontibacter diazotrophicus]RDV12578.1 hypothetical protein DXT99_22705 [Pontibacter diazotrophicus]
MNRNRLYWTSFIALVLFILFKVLTYSNLELRTEELYDWYLNLSFFTLCLLVACITISAQDVPGQIDKALGLIVLIAIGFVWLLSAIPFYSEDKVATDNKILFVHREDSNKRIVQQVHYTGIAGGNENYDTVQTRNITANIRWTEKVDVSQINEEEWAPVKEKNSFH